MFLVKPHLRFLISRPLLGMLRTVEITLLAFGMVIGMYIPAIGAQLDLSIQPDSLTIGDKFLFVNTIKVKPGEKISVEPLGDELGDATVISGVREIPDTISGSASYACTLAVYKNGEAEIPSFNFTVSDSSGNAVAVESSSYKVNIRSVLPPDTTGLDIADIRQPYRIRGPIWPYIVIPLGVIVLAFLVRYLYRRFRGTPSVPQAPQVPAWDVAFGMLDEFKERRHYEYGRIKQYYFELSLIVREYIQRRYDFAAVERTTYELEQEPRLSIIGDGLYSRLFELLTRSDSAKFAKAQPSKADSESDLDFAYNLVRSTIPSVEAPVSDDKKLAVAEEENV